MKDGLAHKGLRFKSIDRASNPAQQLDVKKEIIKLPCEIKRSEREEEERAFTIDCTRLFFTVEPNTLKKPWSL